MILFSLCHKNISKLFLNVFTEENTLSVSQWLWDDSFVELASDDYLFVQSHVRTILGGTADFMHGASF